MVCSNSSTRTPKCLIIFRKPPYLHRQYSSNEMEAAIAAALTHHCAHLDGVQLWLTQLSRPDPTFTTIDLAQKPQLHGIGEQPLQVGMYDSLVGGD